MARIRWNCNGLPLYLFVLVCYGFFMFLFSMTYEKKVLNIEEEIDPSADLLFHRRHRKRKTSPLFTKIDDFYNFMATPQTTCQKLAMFGGSSCKRYVDSGKLVCFDQDVALRPRNCTVFSYGVGNDITFDEKAYAYGCEVHMFDFIFKDEEMKDSVNDKMKFYGYGVGNQSRTFELYVDSLNNSGEKEMRTMEVKPHADLLKMAGKKVGDIDYLKMDIEKSEWSVLSYFYERSHFFEGIKQIAIEIHTDEIISLPQDQILPKLTKFWNILEGLNKLGYKRVHYEPNSVVATNYKVPGEDRIIPTCGEVFYIYRPSG